VFCDGLMLAMVRDDALYFRVDDDNLAILKEAEAFPPLNYEKGGGSIDLRLFDEPDEFLAWARAALGAARRVAAKRATPKRKSKRRKR
jgi:DNA transformation protein